MSITLLNEMKKSQIGSRGVLAIMYSDISIMPMFKKESEMLLKALSGSDEDTEKLVEAFGIKSQGLLSDFSTVQIYVAIYIAALNFAIGNKEACKAALQQAMLRCDAYSDAIAKNQQKGWELSNGAGIWGLCMGINVLFLGAALPISALVITALVTSPLPILSQINENKSRQNKVEQQAGLLGAAAGLKKLIGDVEASI
jgi:hypothetical protein